MLRVAIWYLLSGLPLLYWAFPFILYAVYVYVVYAIHGMQDSRVKVKVLRKL